MKIAVYAISKYEKAIEHGELAVQLDPDNTRLKTNLDYYRAKNGLANIN